MRKIGGSLTALLLVILFAVNVSAQSFSDISGHWAKKEIEDLVADGVIAGYEDGTFRPYASVTRGQFLAYLARALDLPAGDSAFVDVGPGSTLYPEIAAAKKAGIIQGTTEGKALPNEAITRSDVAVMLDRAMQYKGDYMERTPLTFTDAKEIGAYAYASVERMTHYGLIYGTADNTFLPKKIATRGESAVFIHRMMTKLGLLGTIKEPIEVPKPADNQEVIIPINDYQYVKVRMNSSGVPLEYDRQETDKHIESTDYHYYYHMGYASKPLGSLRVTLRKLTNGDTFVFTKFTHNADNTYSATVSLPFSQSDNYSLAKYSDQGTVVREHHDVFGIDETSHPIGVLSAKKGSAVTGEVMMGKNYVAVPKEQKYADGTVSRIRVLDQEYAGYDVQQADNTVTANMNITVKGNAISDSWALVSDKSLFQSSSTRDEWFKRTIAEYISINNWLTADGAYTKLPWSIEPGYQMGYGRSINRMQAGIYLTAYQEHNDRYLYDLVLNGVADLDVFSGGEVTKGTQPLFYTEYTSTWLKKSYGTTAPYVDTRLNENAAMFLKNTGEALGIEALKDDNLSYANFLVNQKSFGNIIPVTASSYMISDYYKPGSKQTHSSLNHALGGMRFLIVAYEQTRDEKYLKPMREFKAGIENLYPKWIRTDSGRKGDFWYQVNPDLTFAGNDYELLTLLDLLLNQEALERIGLPRSAVFDQMIRSKTTYLVENNRPFIDEVVKKLNEQGFGDLISGTRAASTERIDREEMQMITDVLNSVPK
ncbi:S-layer homology domain-containing protein [Domibacillus sp. DTU_2020_1001157_1_SI_ALB_TIR_016]|uniref:S-layer homology domain-containing protein n=1 Tax=Domibacillus sp. DTU_2020_1001157_1_SI_ALB_TIR_016 TaxID=3077789 RepID=UPI0028E7C944|nr:S-layer homology domain-containing protein [Domibacillus sp. DTU_2020_1001157_1_SI_ALB_TIR_016]WNS81286.1 S-layer homology domain-containing protein [Domibacillus sp. DTU_2020_1001157_1_SI_ALB_TIR_016]